MNIPTTVSDYGDEQLDCLDAITKQLRVMNSREARRDRFAAAALAGLCSQYARERNWPTPEVVAQGVVAFADACIAALDAKATGSAS